MADMGTKEAAEKWGVSQKTVQKWCRDGKIFPLPTQDKPGSPWHIEKEAKPTANVKKNETISVINRV